MPSTRNLLPIVLAVTAIGSTACSSSSEPTARQEAVSEAGAEVMPFDLDATTHIFTKTDTGGVEDVVADDPDDTANITAIREHLAEEQDKFTVGDFSDPESIHGSEMPGLAVLEERYDEIDVTLADTPDGAALTYTTSDPEVTAALHEWFDAQVMDHGSDAQHGST